MSVAVRVGIAGRFKDGGNKDITRSTDPGDIAVFFAIELPVPFPVFIIGVLEICGWFGTINLRPFFGLREAILGVLFTVRDGEEFGGPSDSFRRGVELTDTVSDFGESFFHTLVIKRGG